MSARVEISSVRLAAESDSSHKRRPLSARRATNWPDEYGITIIPRSTAGLAAPKILADSGRPEWVQSSSPVSEFRAKVLLFNVTANTRPPRTVGAARIGASNDLRQISLPVAASKEITWANPVVTNMWTPSVAKPPLIWPSSSTSGVVSVCHNCFPVLVSKAVTFDSVSMV